MGEQRTCIKNRVGEKGFSTLFSIQFYQLNSFLAICADFCHLLITFSNSLDPDQDPQSSCRSWSGSKPLDTLMVFLEEFVEKVNLNKKCHKHVTNAPKGIGLAQDTFEER